MNSRGHAGDHGTGGATGTMPASASGTCEPAHEPVMAGPWPAFDPADYPRSYGVAPGWRAVLATIGAALVAAAFVWAAFAPHRLDALLTTDARGLLLIAGPALLLSVVGFHVLISAWRSRVVLHADALELHGAWTIRRMPVADVAGWRGRPGAVRLEPWPGAGRGVTLVPSLYRTDWTFQSWMGRLPNLDAIEADDDLRQVLDDPSLGPTPDQRWRRLQRAAWVPIPALLIALAVMAASWWLDRLAPPLLALMLLLPWIVLLAIALSRGLLRLRTRAHDPRADLSAAFVVACLGVGLTALDQLNLRDIQPLALTAAAAAVLLYGLTLRLHRSDRTTALRLALALPFLWCWAAGSLAWVNVLADTHAPLQVHRTLAIGKHFKTRHLHTEYTLRLNAAGPLRQDEAVHVPRHVFNSVGIGEPMCVREHRGRLGWRWYAVAPCAQDGLGDVDQAMLRQLRRDAYAPERHGPLLRLLVEQQFEALEARASGLQQDFESGRVSDERLLAAWRDFYDPNPDLDTRFDAWIARFPQSHAAYLARGIHRKFQAESLTRAGFVQRMSPHSSAERYLDAQLADLEHATTLTARPILALHHMMDVAAYRRQKDVLRALLERGLALDPGSNLLRRKYLAMHRPMYGGSLRAMEAFVAETRRAGAGQPAVDQLECVLLAQQGWAREEAGDTEAALALFRRAAELPGGVDDVSTALRQVARILMARGRNDQALPLLDRALQLTPDSAPAHAKRGLVLERMRRQPEALQAYQEAARLDNRWAQGRLGRAYLHGEGVPRDPVAAARWLQRAADRGDPQARQTLLEHPELRS